MTGQLRSGAQVYGIGAYRPERTVYNDELCGQIDSSDDWIRKRSGIVSRRFAGPEETVITMGVAAGRNALERVGLAPDRVDAVLVASMSYLYQSPPAGPEIAHRIGARAATAFDIGGACAGFCHALAVADGLVGAGTARHVLVIGTEKMTDIVDPRDRSTAFLFADGAGAAVVGPSDEPRIGPVVWGADGSRSGLVAHDDSWSSVRDKPDFWPWMRMAGQEVFRWVIQEMTPVARAAVAEAGLAMSDLAAFVPHQANLRIIDRMASTLRLPSSVAVARDICTSGNTSAASIPLAIDTLLAGSPTRPRGAALLAGFGAGLSYAAMVITLPSG